MSIFMQVPSLVVKRLHREAEKGAARLRAQLDSEGVGDESDHEADDDVSSNLSNYIGTALHSVSCKLINR